MAAAKPRVLVVPGNGGGGDIRRSCFYGWAETQFKKRGYETTLPEGGMPDPLAARRSIWCPFVKETMRADENAVLIGHSSGAAAALRIAEDTKLRGVVLVAAYDDPLGDDLERASGYFDGPFQWDMIRRNAGFLVQFAGAQDSFLPIDVQRRVASSLDLKKITSVSGECSPANAHVYVEYADGDHFFRPPFQDLVEAVDRCLGY